MTAALLFATIVTAAVIAFLQINGPMVAVAGRSAVALKGSLAHLRQELDDLKTEAAREARAAADAKAAAEAAQKAAPTPSETPSSEPESKRGGPMRPGAAVRGGPPARPHVDARRDLGRPEGDRNDPHGGVDSAGF